MDRPFIASDPAVQGDRPGVIIVTYNSRANFPRLKMALEAQATQYDLIVFDNASRPDERPLSVDFPPHARIIQCVENLGFAAANNRAAALLDTAYFVLLNPDAFPRPDWLQHLVAAAISDPNLGSIGSTQIMAGNPRLYDGAGDCYHASGLAWRSRHGFPRDALHTSEKPFSACGAAALYRADAWRAVGGLDEGYFCYCEDVDLGFRLRLFGWTMRQAPEAVVDHVGGASSGSTSEFAVFHGTRNRTWTFVKCMPGHLFWTLLPLHVAATLAFLLISPFRGTGPATWRGVAAAIAGLGRIWDERRRLQKARTARISSIAAALTWSPWPLIRSALIAKR